MNKATHIELKYKSWSQLPIGKYEKIKEVIRGEVENSDVEILSILCDCDIDDILNAPIAEFRRLMGEASYLNTKLDIKDRLRFKSIVIDGTKYIVNTNFKDITTAQYIDFQTFYKDFEKNYCNVLATFIIPEGHTYNDGYDALETAELFREKLSVETAENACFFFAKRSKTSFVRGLVRLVWRTVLMEARAKDPVIKANLTTARKELMRQIELITGLGRLMKSHIQNG